MTKKAFTTVFIAAAVFCLCFIQAILSEQSRILADTYEIIAQPDETLKNSTVDAVMQIDGVNQSGYYMNAVLELTVGGYSVNLNVYGVSAGYRINDKYTVGSGIILNEAAIDEIKDEYYGNRKSFTDYYTPKYNLGSDELLFNLDAVIEDKTDSEAASAYMNINQMVLLMKKLGKNSDTEKLIIKLDNYSYLEDVKDELKDLDLTVTSDTSAITEKSSEYDIHTLYLSIILAIALLAVIGAYTSVDGYALIAGYFIGTAASLCLPYLFPPAERSNTVFGLSVPVWFYFTVFAAVAMITVFIEKSGKR